MKKPLSIKEPGGLDRWWSVVDANNEIVCVGIENKPTALEIVRCVNAHEALVGALNYIATADGCGCHPVCVCCDASSLLIWKQEAKSLAAEALTLAKETT